MSRLPDSLVLSNGAYYFRPCQSAARIYLGATRRSAIQRYQKYLSGEIKARQLRAAPNDMDRVKLALFSSMKKRAREKGFDVMSKSEFETLWINSNQRCSLTGIRFSTKRLPNKNIRPWVPSVDRINSSMGYQIDNCRLVCSAVNIAMNEWGEGVLLRIARAIIKNRNIG